MIKNVPGKLAALILTIAALSPAATLANDSSLAKEVERGMELWHVPGMAVAVVDSEQVHFQQGFGKTAISNGKDVDEHTLFAIASTTKAMVVAGVLMLADDGELKIGDLVIEYLPELHFGDPSLTQQLTIRDLLAHRTGLPSTDLWTFVQGMPLDEQVGRLRTVEPVAAPRTRLIYQNTMFEIAGMLIEKTSGKPWEEFLTERLWHPIGMNETYAARGRIPASKSHVTPYQYFDDELVVAEWDIAPDHADAAGSVWSSIHDMSLWAQFLLRGAKTGEGDQLISDEGLADMFEPAQLSSEDDFYPTIALTKPHWRTYGLGWFQQDFQGRMINFHTGSLSGLIAIIGMDREADEAVIVLGNRDHAEMRHAIMWDVLDNSAGPDKRDWNQEVFDLYAESLAETEKQQAEIDAARIEGTKPALALESYAGTYRNEQLGDLVVSHEDGQLKLISPMYEFPARHWHVETFEISREQWDFRGYMTFTVGLDAAISGMNVFGADFDRVEVE